MSENLFLGDTTYPHKQSAIEMMYPDSAQRNHVQALINRIEQLERELDQEKTDCTEALLEFTKSQQQLEAAQKVISVVDGLVTAKGRYHTAQWYQSVVQALDAYRKEKAV